jgi:hypothetical protein
MKMSRKTDWPPSVIANRDEHESPQADSPHETDCTVDENTSFDGSDHPQIHPWNNARTNDEAEIWNDQNSHLWKHLNEIQTVTETQDCFLGLNSLTHSPTLTCVSC